MDNRGVFIQELLGQLHCEVDTLEGLVENEEERIALRQRVSELEHNNGMLQRQVDSFNETVTTLVAQKAELREKLDKTYDNMGCARCGTPLESLGDDRYRCNSCENTTTLFKQDMSEEGGEPWRAEKPGEV